MPIEVFDPLYFIPEKELKVPVRKATSIRYVKKGMIFFIFRGAKLQICLVRIPPLIEKERRLPLFSTFFFCFYLTSKCALPITIPFLISGKPLTSMRGSPNDVSRKRLEAESASLPSP
jgi:hypothetical protein